MRPVARARRWYWRYLRRHDGEICRACGRPVALTCPTFWTAPDELWNHVEGGEGGIRCIPCFTVDCLRRGIHVEWQVARQ